MVPHPVHRRLWALVSVCLVVLALSACTTTGITTGPGSTPTPTVVSFRVTSVALSVTPASIAGTTCGTFLTVTYTALFHLAPNGPGGTVQFEYTITNGRGSNPASLVVTPGQTTASYAFQWSGNLPADHTYPEPGA